MVQMYELDLYAYALVKSVFVMKTTTKKLTIIILKYLLKSLSSKNGKKRDETKKTKLTNKAPATSNSPILIPKSEIPTNDLAKTMFKPTIKRRI